MELDYTTYRYTRHAEAWRAAYDVNKTGGYTAVQYQNGNALLHTAKEPISVCEHCGTVFRPSETVADDAMVCTNCIEHVHTCECCDGQSYYVEEASDGSLVCGECIDGVSYFRCEHCEEVHPCHEAVDAVNSDGYSCCICDDCADSDDFVECEDCGTTVHRDAALWYESAYGYICNDCYESNYYTCEACGELVHAEDAVISDGSAYCPTCAQDDNIHDYGYKPVPNFIGDDKNGLYFGLELETDGGDRSAFVEEALELSDNEQLFYFKEDCSLDA